MEDQTRKNGDKSIAPEAFRRRMEAQCESIERYRQRVEREQHRSLSRDEAAMEWIERYADSFQWRGDAGQSPPGTGTIT